MKATLMLFAGLMAVPATASSQTDETVKTRFYTFGEYELHGRHARPSVTFIDARQRVKFERLLKLKKTVLPKLKATAKDAALR